MQSQTITETRPTVVVVLKEASEDITHDDINLRIQELRKILEKESTADCEDPLSLKIKEWAYPLVLNEDVNAEEAFTIFKQLITDPLTGKIFQDPIIDGDWVWEKVYFQEAKENDILSPYTARPLGEGRSHLFLRDLIELSKKLPASFFSDHMESSCYDWNRPADVCRLTHIGRYWARAREDEEAMLQNEGELKDLLREIEKYDARCEEDLERYKASLKEHENHLSKLLSSLKSDREELVQIFTEEKDDLKRKLSELEERQFANVLRIDRLRAELSNANYRLHILSRQVSVLRGECGGSDGGCLVM